MKKNTENAEFKNMSIETLRVKIDALRKELFSLKLNTATGHVKDNSQFKKLRANIARALTCVQQKNAAQ